MWYFGDNWKLNCYQCLAFLILSVVPVLFDYTLAPRKRVAKNLDTFVGAEAGSDMESYPTTVEVAIALRVLEGCCLVSSGCRTTASEHSAVSVNLTVQISIACFTLMKRVLLLECPSAQKNILLVNWSWKSRIFLCTFSLLCWLKAGTYWFLLSWKAISTERLFGWIACCHARFTAQPEGKLLYCFNEGRSIASSSGENFDWFGSPGAFS